MLSSPSATADNTREQLGGVRGDKAALNYTHLSWRFPFLQRSCWMLSGCVGLEYCNAHGQRGGDAKKNPAWVSEAAVRMLWVLRS